MCCHLGESKLNADGKKSGLSATQERKKKVLLFSGCVCAEMTGWRGKSMSRLTCSRVYWVTLTGGELGWTFSAAAASTDPGPGPGCLEIPAAAGGLSLSGGAGGAGVVRKEPVCLLRRAPSLRMGELWKGVIFILGLWAPREAAPGLEGLFPDPAPLLAPLGSIVVLKREGLISQKASGAAEEKLEEVELSL